MSRVKNMVEHRLLRGLSDFRGMRIAAKLQADQALLDELCKRQAELLNWAIDAFPDRNRTPKDAPAAGNGDGVF